jgi:hypothetical protein
MPNTPQTAFARLRALILSTDPLPMTPRMQQQLLGALASPLTRRLAKLAGFGTIASVVLCLTLIVPFTTMVLELSERDVLASLSALSGPMMLICTASVFTYGLSSSLWHAGFHRHAHVADAPEDADAAAETPQAVTSRAAIGSPGTVCRRQDGFVCRRHRLRYRLWHSR